MSRDDGRKPDQLRPLTIEVDYLENPHGSALITQGKTKVLCTAMVQEEVPRWMRNQGRGWMTAEYSLLPASTGDRVEREASRGKQQGRTVEIQRLIGRALRAVVDFKALGERTMWLDCDVLQADGGTRTAAITGGCVALVDACTWLAERTSQPSPFGQLVAAVSVGVVEGEVRLDLAYAEDKDAGVDSNIVMVEPTDFVEVQGTGEHSTFTRGQLETLLDLAESGIAELFQAQRRVLGK